MQGAAPVDLSDRQVAADPDPPQAAPEPAQPKPKTQPAQPAAKGPAEDDSPDS